MTAGTTPYSIAVDPSGKFAYTANSGSDDVSRYTIDQTTGALVPAGTVAAGTSPRSVTVDPTGKYAYVTNYGSCTVLVYTIDPASGALTAAGTIAARSGPMSISIAAGSSAVKYTPKAAYVANAGSNSVSQYTIGTSGALTPMTLATVATGTSPHSVIVDPSGKFAYVANYNSNNVSAYTIDPVTRALTPAGGSPFAAGTSPTAVSIDPSGRFVYVSNYGWPSFGSVSAYTVNALTGALTAIAGSPFGAGNGSSSLDVDPSGRFVYVTNLLNDTITAFSIDPATGALASIQGLSVTNARPVSIAADPTGRFVYAATACGTTWVFGINTATGLLTRADADPGGLCFGAPSAPDALALDPAGRYLYMTPFDVMNQVSAQAIDTSAGTLTAVAGSPFSTGNGTNSVTVDLSGRYAYATGSAGVYQFTIGAVGALTPMTAAPAAAGSGPSSVATTGTIQ